MSDKAPELLPCPFCGKPPISKQGEALFTIRCMQEGCRIADVYANTPDKAAARWNTRPTPSERPVAQVREALALLQKIRTAQHRFKLGEYAVTDQIDRAVLALTERPSAVAWPNSCFMPPFSIYHGLVEIGDANGHVCTAENQMIANELVSILNEAAIQHGDAVRDALKEIGQATELLKIAYKGGSWKSKINLVLHRLQAATRALSPTLASERVINQKE